MKNEFFDNLTSSIESEDFLTFIGNISDDIKDANDKWLQKAAKLGWTIGLTLPPPYFKEIIESNSSENINSKLMEYYNSDDKQLRMKEDVRQRTSTIPPYLVALIEECFCSFENKNYQLTMVGLFSAIEGIMSLFYSDNVTSTRYNNEITQYLDNKAVTYLALPILSLKFFLDNTFKKVPFNKEKSANYDELNRHWALHGRYQNNIVKKEDVIKLFLALSTALFVNDGLRKGLNQ
jgi:hypothetical protein